MSINLTLRSYVVHPQGCFLCEILSGASSFWSCGGIRQALLNLLVSPRVVTTMLSSTSSEACLIMIGISMWGLQECNASSTPTCGDLL